MVQSARQKETVAARRRKRRRRHGWRRLLLLLLVVLAFRTVGDATGVSRSLHSAWIRATATVSEWFGPERGLNLEYLENEMMTAQVVQIRDLSTDEVLGEKNAQEAVMPASTAKLFTVDFALRWLDPEETVEVREELTLVPTDASSARLTPGFYQVRHLVEAALVPSGTDATHALMAAVGRKIANDAALPAQDAIDAGMEFFQTYLRDEGYHETHLVDPGGYSTDNRTTVEDMYRLVKRILHNDVIAQTVSQNSVTVPLGDGTTITYENTNPFLNTDSGMYSTRAKGIKTGSLDGYYNLVLRMDYDDRSVLFLLYGSPTEDDRNHEAKGLADSREERPAVSLQTLFFRRVGMR